MMDQTAGSGREGSGKEGWRDILRLWCRVVVRLGGGKGRGEWRVESRYVLEIFGKRLEG